MLLTFGETMALFVARRTGPLRFARDFDLGVGGAESNVAIGVTRLGGRATWIGRVGADEFGDLVRTTLLGEGVETVAIPDEEAPTGLMIKGRRTADLIDVRYYRSGSAGSRIGPGDLDAELIRSAKVLHVSAITPALSPSAREAVRHAVALARSAGVMVSLDVNYRRKLWSPSQAGEWLRGIVDQVDVIFATEEEAALITDEPEKLPVPHVVLKFGAKGALERSGGVTRFAEPYRVTEVDPVGAGDAFAAGWLAEWMAGGDADRRLRTACAAGAFAVTSQGDWESLPRRADLALLEPGAGDVSR
ncbi:sugar kinase [Nonomuraea soli]|uniref:2-dehydro-3-deoxygluconokinase n=1 Tax=Nonomuraea soli TaxID=1032476 RepID=A0A7W0CMP8_9ACTN|nr:sugar kinase [Nonomuraea soli]MBA2893879.1 2-dehydro-3-deoxygluconokinase [Nonomuraea soli]